RLPLTRVREDAVADLVREIERRRNPERLLVVPEAPSEPLLEHLVERVLASVPERGVARVVTESDRLGQILVQPQRPSDDTRDGSRLERVRPPGADVVAARVDEDLRLSLETPKWLGVDESVAVALEGSTDRAGLLRANPSPGLVGADGERRESLLGRPDSL